jgi:type II secretory pathway component GspD/PulD (secretin)
MEKVLSCICREQRTENREQKTKIFFQKILIKGMVCCLFLIGIGSNQIVSLSQEQEIIESEQEFFEQFPVNEEEQIKTIIKEQWKQKPTNQQQIKQNYHNQKTTVLPGKISLDVKGMDVVDVLKILSDEGDFNFSISGNVTGRVTLFLKDIDVWDALEIVLLSGNLAYEKKGEIIYIMTERDYELKYGKKYWDKRKAQIFSFKNAKASRVKEVFSQMTSNIGKVIIDEPTNTLVVMDIPSTISEMTEVVEKIDKPLETRVFDLDYLSAEQLEQKLTDIITPDVGILRIDEVSNKAIVTDYPERIKDVEKMVTAFDEKPLQVLIDAEIVELTPSKKFYSGIRWEYWLKRYFKPRQVFTSTVTTSADKITFGTGLHETETTEEGEYGGLMEFLQIFGETRTLSTPRILVMNNQEAKILVGTKEAYITSTVSELGESAVTSQSVNFVDVGVKLYVTPTINRKGYVTLKIRPEISSSTSSDLTSEDQVTQVPIVTTSEAETTLIVKEGVSILIGGLRKITQAKERKQVPILGSIPVLGTFFRSNKDEWTKDELVIVLTPHIVSGDRSIEMEVQQKMRDRKMWESDVDREFQKDVVEEDWQIQAESYEYRTMDVVLKEEEEVTKEQPVTVEVASQKDTGNEYQSQIVNRIKNTAQDFDVSLKGKVTMKFTVLENGELVGWPEVVSSTMDQHAEYIAKKIVRMSSPFPKSSRAQRQAQTFEISMSF